jgi:hypothetical protein
MNKQTHTITDLINQLNKIKFTSTKSDILISDSFNVTYDSKIRFDHTTRLYALLPKIRISNAQKSNARAYGWDIDNKDEAAVFLEWFAGKQANVMAAEYSAKEAARDYAEYKFYSL